MITRLYRFITWLSLDVTTGAIVFMSFLSQQFGTTVHWSESAALGVSVWLVYTVDHLIDSRVANDPLSPRRQFHKSYFTPLIVAVFVITGIGVWVLTVLSKLVLHFGLIMVILAVGYLIFTQVRKKNVFKEMQIALGYACGVSLVPFLKIESITSDHILIVVVLFWLALINLVLFSMYEVEEDRSEGFSSLVDFFSPAKLKLGLELTLVLISISGIYFLFFTSFWAFGLIVIIGVVVDAFLLKFPEFFVTEELYRIVGDAVFLLPIVWLI